MIELKSSQQIEKIKEASQILVAVINSLKKELRAGITTESLDKIAYEKILSRNARPAFLGYRGYPKSICCSINEEVVHGIPRNRIISEGDLVSVDVGVEMDGFYSDAALTVGIGNIKNNAAKLISTTKDALYKGLDVLKPGNRLSDLSFAIQSHIENNGLSVIKEFVGHGIGLQLHEAPEIPNFGKPGLGVELKPGMVLAIEPMASIGDWKTQILSDGWTAITKDKSLSAHFEHTVCVTEQGHEILTEGIF
ncbi:MAG: type I methionyl aminopeptidase [Candidatus Omnitrophota bacterium]